MFEHSIMMYLKLKVYTLSSLLNLVMQHYMTVNGYHATIFMPCETCLPRWVSNHIYGEIKRTSTISPYHTRFSYNVLIFTF